MDQNIALPIIFIGIYIAITLLVAIFPFRRQEFKSLEDFHMASGSMGFWIISIGTIVSFYSGTTWTGWQGFISENGALGAYVFPFIATSGVIFYFLSEKIQPLAKEKKLVTIGDYLETVYGQKNIRILAGALSFLVAICWIVMDLTTMGYVFNIVTQNKISFLQGELIALIIILIYILWGGIESIVWTDLLQGIIMLIGGIFVCIFIIGFYFSDMANFSVVICDPVIIQNFTLHGQGMLSNRWSSLIMVSSVAAVCFPATFVRMYMGKNINVLRKTGIFLSITALWSIVYYLPGIASMVLAEESADRQLSLLLLICKTGHILAICFSSVFIIAVCIGTIDILLFTSAICFSKDVVGSLPGLNKRTKTYNQGSQFSILRISVILISCIVFILSILNKSPLISIAIVSTEATAQLFPALVGAAYWDKAKGKGAFLGTIAGIILVVILNIMNLSPFGNIPGFWGLLVNTIIFITISKSQSTASVKMQHSVGKDAVCCELQDPPTAKNETL